MYNLVRSILFQFDPEKVHEFTIKSLSYYGKSPLAKCCKISVPRRTVEVMGLTFDNPVGLAAGMDKNGEAIDGFAAMGFGFIEAGTVTPKPQEGNDKPRCFRIKSAEGIINRMGFNNEGVDTLIENVKKAKYNGVIGINIGKNKNTPIEQGTDDYLICMDKVYPYAGYIAINVSSPNTPELRSLQYGQALDELLSALKQKQSELEQQYSKYVPLALKIAPDLTDEELSSICQALKKYQFDAVIATNTTLDRTLVEGLKNANEAGGLSGKPVQSKSTEIISKLYQQLGEDIPIIGVGGIDSYVAAKEKLQAGAKLVQVFSGLIYQGPYLVRKIVKNI